MSKEEPVSNTAAENYHGETIVIADDNKLIRHSLAKSLREVLPEVEIIDSAENGIEALEIIEKTKPGCVLLDIRMPRMDGLAVARALHTQSTPPEIIIVSAYAEFEYARKAMAFGVKHYLVKPVDDDELIAAVRGALSRRQASRLQNDVHSAERSIAAVTGLTRLNDPDPALQAGGVLTVYRDRSGGLSPSGTATPSHENMAVALGHRYQKSKRDLFCRDPDGFVVVHYDERRTVEESIAEASQILRSLPARSGAWVGAVTAVDDSHDESAAYREARELTGLAFFAAQHRRVFTFDDRAEIARRYVSDGASVRALLDGIARAVGFSESGFRSALESRLRTDLQRALEGQGLAQDSVSDSNTLDDLLTALTVCRHFTDALKIAEAYQREVDALISSSLAIPPAVRCVQEYINSHFASGVTLTDCAESVGYSKRHVSRLLKEHTGHSFADFVADLRVRRAQQLLRTSTLRVNEIARAVGIDSYAHFLELFKRHTGKRPTDFRRPI
jgi:two-component system response regulator YesN